jgi:nucleoside-diphosphate-sugar epimerase
MDNVAGPATVVFMSETRVPPWKKIAVTGAAGNIGGTVARRLHELGYSLVLLDKRPAIDPPQPFVQTDLRDLDAVRAALDGVDAVCHIGEVPNILPGMTGEEVFDINTAVCRTMLAASREAGVKRFIYTSSCQRYGYWGSRQFLTEKLPDVWPLDESQSACATNLYAESKIANEIQCEAAAGAMQILIYRFPWVLPIGPGERTQRHWKRADEQLFEGFWTYLDIRDAAESYVRGLEPTGPDSSQLSTCEAFHFVADEIVGDVPLRQKMERFLPDWPPLPENWGTHMPPVSLEKARRLLGWWPAYRMSAVIRSGAEQTGT